MFQGGGFKYFFIFTPKIGEDFQFDERAYFADGLPTKTTNQGSDFKDPKRLGSSNQLAFGNPFPSLFRKRKWRFVGVWGGECNLRAKKTKHMAFWV